MTPRQLNQWVAQVRERAGVGDHGRDRVLMACERSMRELRGLAVAPAGSDQFLLNGELNGPVEAVLREDDALGRIYQALNAPALEASYRATARDGRKFTDDEIPAVTQLFTPRWVIEFLLHNTLGRLWLEWHPDSSLPLPWLVDRGSGCSHPWRLASSLRVVDPACGTMNFGLVATELLVEMYREEMDRAGRKGWPSEPSIWHEGMVAEAIGKKNLVGVDIDPIALRLARVTLDLKGGLTARLLCGDALFNRTIERQIRDADVVVTNPPFLSARNRPKPVNAHLKRRFPLAWRDAYACFIQRCVELTRSEGRIGMLTMHSYMFTGSFEGLRRKLLEELSLETIAHFGGSLFGVGNAGTLQTAAFTAQRITTISNEVIAMRLVEAPDASSKRIALQSSLRDPERQFRVTQSDLADLPRAAWAYWTTPAARSAFRAFPSLGEIALPRQGLATTDNARFVRYWWEVPREGTKWRPYAKGGQCRRWFEAPVHRVNWECNGIEIKESICKRYPYLNGKWEWVAKNSDYYGREGITYSYLTSARFSARCMPAGSFFDVAGSALFPEDPLTILAVLNSSAAHLLLNSINPTVNFQVGDLSLLPVPPINDDRLRECVQSAIDIQRRLDTFDETLPDFTMPMTWCSAREVHASLHASLCEAEREIDQSVSRSYGLPTESAGEPARFDPQALARAWVSFAITTLLRDSEALQLLPVSGALIDRIREVLISRCGLAGTLEVEEEVGGLSRFLAIEFASWHSRQFKRRPVIWALGCSDEAYLVRHDRASASLLHELSGRIREALPENWERFVDDGIVINLAPLHPLVLDRALGRHLRVVYADLCDGRYPWSETARALF